MHPEHVLGTAKYAVLQVVQELALAHVAQLVAQALAEHDPLARKYPALHSVQAELEVHFLQLVPHAAHVLPLTKYPSLQVVQDEPDEHAAQLVMLLHAVHALELR